MNKKIRRNLKRKSFLRRLNNYHFESNEVLEEIKKCYSIGVFNFTHCLTTGSPDKNRNVHETKFKRNDKHKNEFLNEILEEYGKS